VAVAIGPFVGGYLVQAWSWRLVFFINVPLAIAVVAITRRYVPETHDPAAPRHIDVAGALLAALALGGITYALIELPAHGARGADVLAAGAVGLLVSIVFFVVEARRAAPMLELALFRSRQFSAANAETFVVYAALGGALFLLPIELQQVLGYSPLAAGAALLPATVVMLLLSASMGRLAQRIGPRVPLSLGPLVAAAGLLLLARSEVGRSYFVAVLPALLVFGLGHAITVAPITATVLAAAPTGKAGIASAINNCVARTGTLLAVAMLPAASGLGPESYLHADLFAAGYRRGMSIAAALCASGGALAWIALRSLHQLRPGPTSSRE
ncbi:MAG TPA: MFS transporter, partial [Polyangia bacterium]